MGLWLDGNFWNSYFAKAFVPQINVFCDVMTKRIFPEFESISLEADKVADAKYQRLESLSIGEYDTWDIGDAAERALEAGLAYYESLEGVRQSLLNLTIVALYHMFEQQMLSFHRRQVLHPRDENTIAKIKMGEMKRLLSDSGLNLESLASWPKIDELRIVANTIKHAEGTSSEQAKDLRLDLFKHPLLGDEESRWAGQTRVYMPLGGKDIYIRVNDLESYRSALVAFWKEFGEAIKQPNR